MHIKKILTTLILSSGSLLAHGQINLSAMEPLSTDSLQKNKIRYFSPGSGGLGRTWNFSHKLGSKGASKVTFCKDSIGALSIIENGRINYYSNSSDTLILDSCESPLSKKLFVNGKTLRKIPIVYGDSVNNSFRCDGMYCGNHPFRESGSSCMKVDGVGNLILTGNDTIHNVLRVHSTDTYSVCMDLNVDALDTAKLTQVIDERYEWYLPESQYPIIENITSTTYYNMQAIGTTKCAFCNLPEDMAILYITEDDSYGTDEDEGASDAESDEPDIMHYKIETQGGIVKVTYNLDEDATISTIIANHLGMPYYHNEWSQRAGQGFSTQIDCSALLSGIYILYINVNGKAYSEKITL